MKMKNRYGQILLLTSLFYELQQQASVRHNFRPILKERLSSPRYVELIDLLIRQITLQNRAYRIKENGAYISEKEDLVIALNLLHSDIKRETLLNPRTSLALHQLKSVFGYERLFRRKDVERITKYKKSHAGRLIGYLLSCEKIERKGGSKNRGYYYQLIKEESLSEKNKECFAR